MNIELSWYLLLVGLSALYGLSEYRAMTVLGYSGGRILSKWAGTFLLTAALAAGWVAAGYPLPLYYALIYLARIVRFLPCGWKEIRYHFFLNLNYGNTLTLHLFFIGIAALVRGVTMQALLADPFWRAAGVCFVILLNTVEDYMFRKGERASIMLTAAAQSEEARPFMAFLWFSNVYLLLDSLLCVAGRESFYTALFLVGSSIFLIFFQISFLVHIGALIRSEYLREEHDALEARLKERDRSVHILKRMAGRDALTGVGSRRYAMEKLSRLLRSGQVFSLIFLDMDRLKQINDREGHDAGDHYLIRFAGKLGSCLRGRDVLARVGGDEFLILMPGCSEASAKKRIEAIRDFVMEEKGGENRYSFSYGVTCVLPGSEKDAETLLKEADQAMYRDKARRR